jgi:hypothetical protein
MNGYEFWQNVNIKKHNECWEWKKCRHNKGYGLLCFNESKTKSKGMKKAHRVSYELYYGDIPEGMSVLHSCDNPVCRM